MSSSPCCPPNSEKFLASDYAAVGFSGSLPDGTEFYASGTPEGSNGIVFIPDVYGTNGGRTKNLIDQFAEAGYFTVAPKLLIPPFEGGTDGEGLNGEFDFTTRGAEFVGYAAQFTWEKMRPQIEATVAYMKNSGVQKIGIIGFCWGGLVVVHALNDLAEDFVAGVIPHPSVHLEDYLGRSAVALFEKVKRPILLMPAGNDPESYLEGGAMFTALKSNNPESETVLFKDVVHGWVPRGDLANPVVKENVELAVDRTYAYFARFF